MKQLIRSVTIALTLLVIATLMSCVARFNADGSREYRPDSELFLKAVEIHANK